MSEEGNSRRIGSFNIDLDSKINAKTVITFLVFFWALAAAWADLKNDVGNVENDQTRLERFRTEAEENHITKEQLNYIVIERLDRLEEQLETQLDRIEKKINE